MKQVLFKTTILIGIFSFWGCLDNATGATGSGEEEKIVDITECTSAECTVVDSLYPAEPDGKPTLPEKPLPYEPVDQCTPIFNIDNGQLGELVDFNDGVDYCFETIQSQECVGNYCIRDYGYVWTIKGGEVHKVKKEDETTTQVDGVTTGPFDGGCTIYQAEDGSIYDKCETTPGNVPDSIVTSPKTDGIPPEGYDTIEYTGTGCTLYMGDNGQIYDVCY